MSKKLGSFISMVAGTLVISSANVCLAADDDSAPRWGYINPSGAFAIEANFLSAGDFSEGLAPVKAEYKTKDGEVNSAWGFIDKTGKTVIEPQFDEVLPFSEGLAAFRKDKWGFIDKSGKIVIEPQFESVRSFKSGLAGAAKDYVHWGFIDKTGAWKIEPRFASACQFANDRAAVLSGDGFGAFNMRISEDLYQARGGFFSYIDKDGKVVIDSLFQGAGLFEQGLAPASVGINQGVNKPDSWGFIKPDGKFAIKPQFNAVHAPSEGCAAVQFGNWKNIGQGIRSWVPGKWGYINLSGKKIINGQFDRADRFSSGFAGVLLDGKWGFIDKNGKQVIAPAFSACGEFHDELAPVCLSK